MMELLANPQDQSRADVSLIEQMRFERLRTTVISRSINDSRAFVQFELERVQAKR